MSDINKQKSPFWDYINMKELLSENGKSVVEIIVFPDLLQRRGYIHGGVIATLIDASIGSAVRSQLKKGEVSATVELKTNFIRPATGLKLIGKASVKQRGKTLAVGTSEIFDDQEKLIAIGTATFIIQGQ